MDSLIKDIRFGIRSLLKRPGFTAIAAVRPMTALIDASTSSQRYNMMLLGLFAVWH